MSNEEVIRLLQEENRQLREIISRLEKRIVEQANHIVEQDKRIAELEEQLRKALIPKNSANSSMPPSSDIKRARHNKSLRHKSGKKPGGQPGHKGTTLKMTDRPEEIVDLLPSSCQNCGYDLENEEAYLKSKRQVVDIPPIECRTTEYRNYCKYCPKCGNCQRSKYPEGVKTNIQYGQNIHAAVSYLSVYQHLPFKRLTECVGDFFNLEISQGSIDNILKAMSEKAWSEYERIKSSISESPQIGSDETSAKVNGKKQWIWTWQTSESTFLFLSDNRAAKTIDALFPAGFPNSILNSDRWAAQLNTNAKGHQLCLAHLLRDLKLIQELEDNQLSYAMEAILKESMDLKDIKAEYSPSDPRIMEIEECLDILLNENIPEISYPKTHVLQKSLIKWRDSLFSFLYDESVPPDNNGSERAIRNVKVKTKVSGQFKSNGNVFCILRSIIDTSIKMGIDIFSHLKFIARLAPAE